MKKPKIAIIGAGISGLTLASELKPHADVKIFEKSRGVGGRMSTRYVEQFAFDHGAQCFSARTKAFQKFLEPFIIAGDVMPWMGNVVNIENDGVITPRFWFETHLAGSPNMNSLCKKIALNFDLDVSCDSEVIPIIKKDYGWNLQDKNGNNLGIYDFVISTAPPEQTKNIFGDNFAVKIINMTPCFSMMLGFQEKWQFDWIFAKVRNNPIKLISVNSSKPKRNSEVTSLIIQTRDSWSINHLEDNQEKVAQILLANFTQVTGIDYKKASYQSLHRWKYALVDEESAEIFFDKSLKLAATSDWTTNSRIEDVWLSAKKLAQDLKNHL